MAELESLLRDRIQELTAERDAALEDRELLQGRIHDKDFELTGLHKALRKETEDRERLRGLAQEAREGLWELLKDPVVPHRLAVPPGMSGSRDRQRWDRAVAAHEALRAALEGRP